MEQLISRKEAAKILGISLRKLDYEREEEKIAYIQYVEGGCVYFTEQALQEYMARCTHRAKPIEAKPIFRRTRRTGRT